MHMQFIEPSKRFADVINPEGDITTWASISSYKRSAPYFPQRAYITSRCPSLSPMADAVLLICLVDVKRTALLSRISRRGDSNFASCIVCSTALQPATGRVIDEK